MIESLSRRRLIATMGVAGSLAGCADLVNTSQSSDDEADVLYVAPDGEDGTAGTEDDPLASIQTAVERADPGDTVYVQPGEYFQYVEIREGGDPDAPLTITGPPDAVLKPPRDIDYQAISVGASHVHLTGLTVSGLYNPDEPENPDSYHVDKLIGLNSFAEEVGYIEDLVVSPHRIGGAGGALINSRRIKNCDIGGFKVIGPAGARWIFDDTKGHYGEIVYLGTAPDNIVSRGSFEDYDNTRNVRVHHIDNSAGHPHAEFVDCKAGTENITIEYCTDAWGAEQDEGGDRTQMIHMQGQNCTIRWNVLRGSRGDGIELYRTLMRPEFGEYGWRWRAAPPETDFERRIATNNAIYGNVITECTHKAIAYPEVHRVAYDERVGPDKQRLVCGNVVGGPTDGTPTTDCPADLPPARGIGHLGGDSPWRETPGDLGAVQAAMGTPSFTLDSTLMTDACGVARPLRVETVVRNDGEVRGRTWVRLAVAGTIAEETQVTLDPGEETRLAFAAKPVAGFTVPSGSTGDRHPVTINGSEVGAVSVDSLFELDYEIRDERVTVGDPIAVDLAVGQTGETPGQFAVILTEGTVDGVVLDRSNGEVPPGPAIEASLSWPTQRPRKYPLALNGLEIGAVVAERPDDAGS